MEQIDVLAVVGSCAPERNSYAMRLAKATGRLVVQAQRLAMSPDPVDEAVALAPWSDRPQGVVFEFPGSTVMTELIGTLAAPGTCTALTGVVCVVDAAHLLKDLASDSYAYRPGVRCKDRPVGMYTARAMLTVTQIEYASEIVLVNWEPLATDELSAVMALVCHLSPHARLRLDSEYTPPGQGTPVGEPYAVGQQRPGWVSVLNDDHSPHMTDPRVSAFRYDNVRPMHPQRLQTLLDERIEPGEFGTVIRSAGFCRFATRAHVVGQWDHVGRMISFEPVSREDFLEEGHEPLALGQDLAFIGIDLDRAALTAALDQVVLDDAELATGPETWGEFTDPFPAWPKVTGH